MRLHLDTTFLVDWQREDARIEPLRDEMRAGMHDVSYDPILEIEYFAVRDVSRRLVAVFESMRLLARWVPVTPEASRIAAQWLSQMDEKQRKAHFADAIIGAVAYADGAVLVTSERILPEVFPVAVLQY